MSSAELPARIGYAACAFAAAGAAAFYAAMWLLPKIFSGANDDDGYGIFRAALGVGLALGFSAGMAGLTLPWKRRRRRSGRGRRMAISCAIVVAASVGFASQSHLLLLDLAIAVWLAYMLAFTYVRYGVLDKAHSGAAREAPAAGSE